MNTAGQDLYTGNDHGGDLYGPNRVGSGRIDVKAALDNKVLAYTEAGSGVVSASFGVVEVAQEQVQADPARSRSRTPAKARRSTGWPTTRWPSSPGSATRCRRPR